MMKALFFLLLPVLAQAQIKATTEFGKNVVLMDDGTWTYAEITKSEEVVNKECGELITKEYDKMSGKHLVSSVPIGVEGKGSFHISLTLHKKYTSMLFVVDEAACIDQGSQISILFKV